MKRSGIRKPVAPREKQWEGPVPAPRTHVLRIPDGKARMVVPFPKEDAYRSRDYRMLVGTFACCHCGLQGHSQAAHADIGKGLGIKSDDRTCFALCAERPNGRIGCHTLIGATGTFSREHRRTLEHTYACRTIARVRRMGKWESGLDLPVWFDPLLGATAPAWA